MAELDPSILGKALTSNERLLRSTILHAVYVERVKARLGQEAVAFLNEELFPDLLAQATKVFDRFEGKGGDPATFTSDRYAAMIEELRGVVDEKVRELEGEVTTRLFDQAKLEATFAAKQVDQASPFALTFTLPDPDYLQQLVTSKPFQGAVLSDWFSGLTSNTQDRVAQQVNLGLAQGETVDQLVARLRGTKANSYTDGAFQTTRREAEAIARTAANHVSSATREAVFSQNDDLVSGMMWVATLDDRTCPVCGKLDGKVFTVDGKGARPPGPPNHYQCRCTLSPVLKSWKELGFSFDDTTPASRASANGVVPGALTYPQWLKTESVDTQNEALGPVRADLFRSGELRLSQFTDDRGNLLTLEQLAKKYGIELPAQYQ